MSRIICPDCGIPNCEKHNEYGVTKDDLSVVVINRILHEAHLIKQEVRAVGHIEVMPPRLWEGIRHTMARHFKREGLLIEMFHDGDNIDIYIFKYRWALELFEQASKLPHSDPTSHAIKGLLYGYSLREIDRFLKWKSKCIHAKKEKISS